MPLYKTDDLTQNDFNAPFAIPERKFPREQITLEEANLVSGPDRLTAALAAFGKYNPVTSIIVSDSTLSMFDRLDPDYDQEEDMEGYEEYKDVLMKAKNPIHMRRLKSDIDRQQKYSRQIQDGGATGVVSALAAGIMDPIAFAVMGPFSTPAKGAKLLKQGAKMRNVGAGAARTSAEGLVGAGATELVLQATQPDLSVKESINAIAAGALLGGVLGAAGRSLTVKEYKNLSARYKKDLSDSFLSRAEAEVAVKKMDELEVKAFNSVSSAGTPKLTMDDLSVINDFGLVKAFRWLAPSYRVMSSASLKARDVYTKLAGVPFKLKGAENGVALNVSAEEFAKQYNSLQGRAVQSLNSRWKEHKSLVKDGKAEKISQIEFRQRVSQALRRGDEDINGSQSITSAAKDIRKQFLDPMKQNAIDAGLFPEDIGAKFAESYLTRMWNPKAITENIGVFKEKMTDWATGLVERNVNNIESLYQRKAERAAAKKQKLEKSIQEYQNRIAELESRTPTKFDYRSLAEVQDDYLEFIKKEIGLQELGSYLSRNELEDVAEIVNTMLVKMPKKPKGVVQYIIDKGGVKPDSWLKTQGITNKARPGLFSEKAQGLDVVMQKIIADTDYFPEYKGIGRDLPDNFGADDLRQAIQEDLFGRGVYRDADIDTVNQIELLTAQKEEASRVLSQLGFDDYKNFYKEIYDDISKTKSRLKGEAKAERLRLKFTKQGAKAAAKGNKEFRDELAKMRKAQAAMLRRQIKTTNTKIKHLDTRLDDDLIRKNTALAKLRNAVDDGYSEVVKEIVDEVTANLTQLKKQAGDLPFIAPSSIGVTKNKLLSVDDVDFEEFLENDISMIMDYYRNNLGTQIEIKRTLGSVDLKDEIQEIQQEYSELIDAADTPKERNRLKKEGKKVVEDIKSVRDIMLGTHNAHFNPDSVLMQAGTVLRDLNYTLYMGGVTISSLPDMARSIMVNGFGNTMDGVKLKAITGELKKATTEELQEMGFLYESVLASRLQSLAEIGDPLTRGTALTRFSGNAANIFSKVNLINYWNDMQKSVAALATQSRLQKALFNGGDDAFLLENGIDTLHANVIKRQIKKHGDGKLSGIKDWDMDEANVSQASRLWKAAINRNADIAIVTKGAGDLPVVASHPGGRVALQFKSFLISSHGRVLIRGIQSRNKEAAGTILGATAMVAMGMMVAAIKAEIYNRSAETKGLDKRLDIAEWNKRKWLLEGIDRSGMVALLMEPLHFSDKAIGLGPSSFTGQGISTRYASRGAIDTILGPSTSTVSNVFLAGRAGTTPIRQALGQDAELSKNDVYAARKIVPYQNAFGFRQMFDILERETGEALGAE